MASNLESASLKDRIRAASDERQRRIAVAKAMEPIDYQSRGGAITRTETIKAGVSLARRQVITYLDLYHWQWKVEHRRIKRELAGLDIRFQRHAKKITRKKQRRRIEIRRNRFRNELFSELAGHLTSPKIGIIGDHADAGHRFMAEYQHATGALAGRSIWIGERLGGGATGGERQESAALIAEKVSRVVRNIEAARDRPTAHIILSVCGANESVTAAGKKAGLADRRGKAIQKLRDGLEYLCGWYSHEFKTTPRSRRKRAPSSGRGRV